MNSDATSLDRLHDIVLPTAVSWWPLAPGWYVLFGLTLLFIVWFIYRRWKRWQGNAYRRQALRELGDVTESFQIAELLRRTALAVVPRSEVAQKTGAEWADWLAGQCPVPMTSEVHQFLAGGVYSVSAKEQNVDKLRDYAVSWITRHHLSSLHAAEKLVKRADTTPET